jgi:hypothetical protein
VRAGTARRPVRGRRQVLHPARVQRRADARPVQVRRVRRSVLRLGPEALQGLLAVWLPEQPEFPVSSVSSWHRPAAFPERQLPERQLPEAARALVRAVDRQVPPPVRAWRLASQREPSVSRTAPPVLVSPVLALSVLSLRRSAAFSCRAHPEAARARAVDQPARHSASPAALARASRQAVSAAWGVLVLRPVAQHGAAARRAASGAAEALLPEAEALRA